MQTTFWVSLCWGFWGGEDGEQVGQDSWSVILGYEHEVRREMVTKMPEGVPLGKALRQAWTDPVVRDRYLVTPLQKRGISGRRAAPQANSSAPRKQRKKADTAGAGKDG